MKTIFSNAHLIISLHENPVHDAIEIQWLDFVPSADFRAGLLEMLRLARLHRVRAWVADNRLIRALRPVDLAWAGSDVIAPMSKLGVRRLAIVESQDAMNRMGVNSMLATVIPNTQLTSQLFPTMTEARAWALQPF